MELQFHPDSAWKRPLTLQPHYNHKSNIETSQVSYCTSFYVRSQPLAAPIKIAPYVRSSGRHSTHESDGKLSFSFLLFLVLTFLPNRHWCGGILLHRTTFHDTYTFGRTPLDEGSARCKSLYLTLHKITRERHQCLWRDSNPQSQKESGRRPKP